MQTFSINGRLKPTDSTPITDQYRGHFLKVSYIQEVAQHPVYSKDRSDVQEDGQFRFYLPKQDLLENEMITLEIYAPDGMMMGRQIYSYGRLKASNIPQSAEDNSEPLMITVDPRYPVQSIQSVRANRTQDQRQID